MDRSWYTLLTNQESRGWDLSTTPLEVIESHFQQLGLHWRWEDHSSRKSIRLLFGEEVKRTRRASES